MNKIKKGRTEMTAEEKTEQEREKIA